MHITVILSHTTICVYLLCCGFITTSHNGLNYETCERITKDSSRQDFGALTSYKILNFTFNSSNTI